MIKFPKIQQFRGAAKYARKHVGPRVFAVGKAEGSTENDVAIEIRPQTMWYRGTVKLHGTNAAVRIEDDGRIVAQSRNRELTPHDDNMGFAAWLYETPANYWRTTLPGAHVIYGEWCGKGVNKGTAISSMDKMFVVFAVLMRDGTWGGPSDVLRFDDEDLRVFNVELVDGVDWLVDLSNPIAEQTGLVDLTNEVGDQCPFAAHFGVTGPGEGIVWRPRTPSLDHPSLWFKTKAASFSEKSERVPKATVDPRVSLAVSDFVDHAVTGERLGQGLDYLREMGHALSRSSTGHFLKWISRDILDEESDTLADLGLEWKDAAKRVQAVAREWLFDYLDRYETAEAA